MKILKKIGSTFLIPLSIPFMLEETDYRHKVAVFLIFLSSVLYHGFCKEIKKEEKTIYILEEKYEILRIIDKICICYIYLHNSRLFENYSLIVKYLLCFFFSLNETRLLFFLITCLIFITPYFTLIPLYQTIFFIFAVSIKGLIYLTIEDFTFYIKYIWHFFSSLTMFTASYINFAYYLPKTETYHYVNKVVISIYYVLVINYFLYKINNLNKKEDENIIKDE